MTAQDAIVSQSFLADCLIGFGQARMPDLLYAEMTQLQQEHPEPYHTHQRQPCLKGQSLPASEPCSLKGVPVGSFEQKGAKPCPIYKI